MVSVKPDGTVGAQLRGFKPPSKVKYEKRQKKKYKLMYMRIQSALAHIELDRALSARRRKLERLRREDESEDDDDLLEDDVDTLPLPGEIH